MLAPDIIKEKLATLASLLKVSMADYVVSSNGAPTIRLPTVYTCLYIIATDSEYASILKKVRALYKELGVSYKGVAQSIKPRHKTPDSAKADAALALRRALCVVNTLRPEDLTYRSEREASANKDYGCNFDENGKCKAYHSLANRRTDDFRHSDQMCCSQCRRSCGYLGGHRVTKEEAVEISELFDPTYGFWTPQGCALPRKLRSRTCTEYRCYP